MTFRHFKRKFPITFITFFSRSFVITVKRLVSLPQATKDKYNYSSMKKILVGAAPCPVQVKEEVFNMFGPSMYITRISRRYTLQV